MASPGEIWREFLKSIWALFMPLGLIMGLRVGIFTASEAGAVCVAYTYTYIYFVYKELKVEMLPQIIKESIYSTCSVMLIIVSRLGFQLLHELGKNSADGHRDAHIRTTNPYVFLLIVNVFLLVLGMFLEGTASLIILTPLILPVATSLGIDPVHLGIVMVVNITIGGMTPPFGTLIFVVCSTLKLKVTEFVKESIPFLAALIGVLFLITYVPGLVTFLPNLIG